MDDKKKVIFAVAGIAVAAGLLVWQFALRPDPNAVGVADMPASTRMQPGTQRDAAAGPMPVDLSAARRR